MKPTFSALSQNYIFIFTKIRRKMKTYVNVKVNIGRYNSSASNREDDLARLQDKINQKKNNNAILTKMINHIFLK